MSESFGAAFIDVNANTAPFLRQIEELKAIIARTSVILNVRQAGASPITSDGNLRGAAERAAAAARIAAAGQDDLARASNSATKAVNSATKAVDENAKSLDRNGRSSRSARLLLLGLVVAFAAVEASAVAAGAAVAAAGIKAEESIRTLRLSITDTGASLAEANKQIAALQDLAGKGLSFTGLITDNKALEDLNLTAAQSVSVLTQLGDIGAGEGLVGTGLDTFVDGAVKAIANISQAKNVTAAGLKDITSALGISQTQLRKQLGLTQKQLLDLADQGKLTTAKIVEAAVAAANAQPNTKNGLTNATGTSVIQAFDAIKQQLGTTIGQAFDNPEIAKSITGVAGKLKDAVASVAPEIQKDALAVVDFLGSAIGPVSDFLASTLRQLGNFFKEATTEGTDLNKFFDSLRGDIADIGTIAVPVLGGIATVLGGIVELLKPLLDLLAEIGRTQAGKALYEVAGAITAIVFIVSKVSGPIGLIVSLAAAAVYAYESFVKFREIVNDAFIAIATVAGNAVELLVNGVAGFATGTLGFIKAILDGLSYLPDWLGGGKFTDAANAVQELINGINAVQSAIDDTIDAGIAAVGTLNQVGNINFGNTIGGLNAVATAAFRAGQEITAAGLDAALQSSPGSNELTGGLSGRQASAAAGNEGPHVKISIPSSIGNPFSGLGANAGGGGGSSKAATAANAIKQATAAFKAALKGFTDAIGSAQTVDAVNTAFDTLQKAIDTEDKALGRSEPKGLVTYLGKQKAALVKAAQEVQLALQERASFLGQADISKVNTSIAGSAGILQDLQRTLANSKEFAADIKILRKEGLNQTAINQLLAVGPTDAGLQAAANLVAAGQSIITGSGGINDLQTQIAAQGESLGKTIGGSFQDAQTQASQNKIDGIASSIPAIQRAAAGLAGQTMTNTFNITVNGTVDGKKTGNTLGHAIADTLMARKLSAALAG